MFIFMWSFIFHCWLCVLFLSLTLFLFISLCFFTDKFDPARIIFHIRKCNQCRFNMHVIQYKIQVGFKFCVCMKVHCDTHPFLNYSRLFFSFNTANLIQISLLKKASKKQIIDIDRKLRQFHLLSSIQVRLFSSLLYAQFQCTKWK